jgi:hypothetical protein
MGRRAQSLLLLPDEVARVAAQGRGEALKGLEVDPFGLVSRQ